MAYHLTHADREVIEALDRAWTALALVAGVDESERQGFLLALRDAHNVVHQSARRRCEEFLKTRVERGPSSVEVHDDPEADLALRTAAG